MRNDVKVGMLIGTVLVAAAMVTVAVWPGASIEARLLRTSRTAEAETPEDGASTEAEASSGVVRPAPGPASEPPRDPPRETLEAARAAVQSVQPAADPPTVQVATSTMRTHVVQPGQTLSHIAQQYYGSATQWRKIAEANKAIVPNPNRVTPGTRLKIPD
jgi:nucleoid-associated protein YgaU